MSLSNNCDDQLFCAPHRMAKKSENHTYFFENDDFDPKKCDTGEDIVKNMYILCTHCDKIVQ
jgi:hypothetical protein